MVSILQLTVTVVSGWPKEASQYFFGPSYSLGKACILTPCSPVGQLNGPPALKSSRTFPIW